MDIVKTITTKIRRHNFTFCEGRRIYYGLQMDYPFGLGAEPLRGARDETLRVEYYPTGNCGVMFYFLPFTIQHPGLKPTGFRPG